MSKDKRISVSFDREACCFVGVSPELLQELATAYPGVNLRVEFLKMSDWLCSSKGKDRKGSISFVTNWLSRAPVTANVKLEGCSELDHLVDKYLKEAWKKYDYLETLNTMPPLKPLGTRNPAQA